MLNDHDRALARFWRGKDVTRALVGHVTGIEIALRSTHGRAEAGVHSHSLVELHSHYFSRTNDLYLSQRRLVALWRKALRADYNPICHITAVAPGDHVHASLRECIKYAVAPHKLFARGNPAVDPLIALHLADALYKRRLVRFGGSFSSPRRVHQSGRARSTPPRPPTK